MSLDGESVLTAKDARRLRDLLIEQDCILAIKRYSFGIDLGDREMLLQAFHEDAIIQMGPTWIMQGHAEIGKMVEISSRWGDKHHISSDHQVIVESDTVAHGLCHGIALYVSKDLVHISGTARYRDRFERRNDVWRIADRRVEIRYFCVHSGAEVTLNPPEMSNEWLAQILAKEKLKLRPAG